MRALRPSTAGIGIAMLATLALTSVAVAQEGAPGRGGHDRNQIEESGGEEAEGVFSLVEVANSRGDTESPGTSAGAADPWVPPACWYEPRTPVEVRAYVRHLGTQWENEPGQVGDTEAALTRYYARGSPYENFHLDVADEGYFWFGVMNPERAGESEAQACSRFAEWVEHDDTPREALAVTPAVMAEAAYEWLPLPELELSASPDFDDSQIVNLPSWVWHDTGDLEPVHATATLDRLDLTVTTTATPEELTLTGADSLALHPADGTCPLRSDGSLGERWDRDQEGRTPPCGFTPHRAGHHELTATLTWSVTWTGTGQDTPLPLPDATTETTHALTTEEVQAIVR